jgi:hypothetical protein
MGLGCVARRLPTQDSTAQSKSTSRAARNLRPMRGFGSNKTRLSIELLALQIADCQAAKNRI